MNKTYIMNTKTRVNADKVFAGKATNEFLDFATDSIVFFSISRYGQTPTVVAVAEHGRTVEQVLEESAIGDLYECINDTGLGHRAMGTATVVAVLGVGRLEGNPDSKYSSVPLYVFK